MCEKRAYKCYLLGLIKLKKGKSRRDVVKKQSKMCENKSVKTDKNNPEKLNVFRGLFGTPYWIRTNGLSLRRRTLYPTELMVHIRFCGLNRTFA